LADTIKRYVKVYNQHISQKALGHILPFRRWNTGPKNRPSCSKNVSII